MRTRRFGSSRIDPTENSTEVEPGGDHREIEGDAWAHLDVAQSTAASPSPSAARILSSAAPSQRRRTAASSRRRACAACLRAQLRTRPSSLRSLELAHPTFVLRLDVGTDRRHCDELLLDAFGRAAVAETSSTTLKHAELVVEIVELAGEPPQDVLGETSTRRAAVGRRSPSTLGRVQSRTAVAASLRRHAHTPRSCRGRRERTETGLPTIIVDFSEGFESFGSRSVTRDLPQRSSRSPIRGAEGPSPCAMVTSIGVDWWRSSTPIPSTFACPNNE